MLITRCSACQTEFRVSEAQLDARNGWVRCGRCFTVFDARSALIAGSPAATEPDPETALRSHPADPDHVSRDPTPSEPAAPAGTHAGTPTIERPTHLDASAGSGIDLLASSALEPGYGAHAIPRHLADAQPEPGHAGTRSGETATQAATAPDDSWRTDPAAHTPSPAEPANDNAGAPQARDPEPTHDTPAEPAIASDSGAGFTDTDDARPDATASADASTSVEPPAPASAEASHDARYVEPDDPDRRDAPDGGATDAAPALPASTDSPEIGADRESGSAAPTDTVTDPHHDAVPGTDPAAIPQSPVVTTATSEPVTAATGADDVPMLLDFGPKPRKKHTALWIAGSIALLLALGAQAAFHFRGTLALVLPEAKPYLEYFCAALGCDLPLPRRAELLSIETSDLQGHPNNPGIMVLAATLRNRAPFPQAFPALELTLTDDRDQPLARRVLQPGDYLGPSAVRVFGPSSEQAIRVFIEASALKATSYRLYLFHP